MAPGDGKRRGRWPSWAVRLRVPGDTPQGKLPGVGGWLGPSLRAAAFPPHCAELEKAGWVLTAARRTRARGSILSFQNSSVLEFVPMGTASVLYLPVTCLWAAGARLLLAPMLEDAQTDVSFLICAGVRWTVGSAVLSFGQWDTTDNDLVGLKDHVNSTVAAGDRSLENILGDSAPVRKNRL